MKNILFNHIIPWILCFIRYACCPNCFNDKTQELNLRFLKEHNEYRKDHEAPPLGLDNGLIQASVKWSTHLAVTNTFSHSSQSSKFPYGENLYSLRASNFSLDMLNPVKAWYDEVDLYYYDFPGFSSATGHFTQVVWKGTRKVGCGVCKLGSYCVITCRYLPPGNFEGQFPQNVGVSNKRGYYKKYQIIKVAIILIGILSILGVIYYIFHKKSIDDNDGDFNDGNVDDEGEENE